MSFDFKGKVALVTGASCGIGKATSLKLARAGASLVICARNKEPLEATANNIREMNVNVLACCADIKVESSVIAAIEQAIATFGQIDILINCAGGNGVIKPILELSELDWQQDLSQNLMGVVRFCKATLPYMRKARYGRVVNISSIAGIQPSASYTPYCVAKAGIISYSKALSEAFSTENILTNVILPGLVDTRQMSYVETVLSSTQNVPRESVHRSFEKGTILGRYATPEEVANLIVFLVSPCASYITGAAYIIDGGLVKTIMV